MSLDNCLIPEQLIAVAAMPPATPDRPCCFIRMGPKRHAAVLQKIRELPGLFLNESAGHIIAVRADLLRRALGYEMVAPQNVSNAVGLRIDHNLGEGELAALGFGQPVDAELADLFSSVPGRPTPAEGKPQAGKFAGGYVPPAAFQSELEKLAAGTRDAGEFSKRFRDLLAQVGPATIPGPIKQPSGAGNYAGAKVEAAAFSGPAAPADPPAASRIARGLPAWLKFGRDGTMLEWLLGGPKSTISLSLGVRVIAGGCDYAVRGMILDADGGLVAAVLSAPYGKEDTSGDAGWAPAPRRYPEVRHLAGEMAGVIPKQS